MKEGITNRAAVLSHILYSIPTVKITILRWALGFRHKTADLLVSKW